ncbi:hypothetical protein Bcop_0049 [Bacteroides coprosuis DSM 18011]|uniref:Methionyl-tRNA formyltransferase n=1 Tax=Bacteroides coprosuis DSM 18011 TaxID=679937 RepID=F3ZP42_9BACE|nr:MULTISPECIES: DUF4290 domain-containing protein [Bacteroides]EGJ70269.1 hypothetical protein Bcop_0049 [Bacteroides coprosuis DSM 18011]HJD93292.1 DUF4290 domain-containing protein [Bacteroides coprosuis]
MEYNTQKMRMPLPEYGRSIQNMVNYALTIEDRSERQRCANTIIDIMGNMFPHLRDVPDFKHKLWDHLAIMSDFKLDIDYPYEIVREDNLHTRPSVLPYPQTRIRFRHYGKTIEKLISEADKLEDGDEKNHLVALIANHMKKSYTTWNRDSIDDEKIDNDLRDLSRGTLRLNDAILKIMNARVSQYQNRPKNRNNQRRNYKH